MRAAALGMVLLCGIAQGVEPPDADRPVGEDRKAAVVAQAKQQIVELEKKRVAAVKRRDGGLISALVNDIRLAKIELKEALKKTVEDYAREADAEAEKAARKADAKAKEAARKADAVANLKLELIEIPAGKFMMGSPAGEKDPGSNEEQVAVELSKSFWLGKTEVTQGQWKQVMGTEPWKGEYWVQMVQIGEDNAASCVDWNAATAFCQKLTDLARKAGKLPAGESYRLPTEAEWEYACRAGTTTAFSFGDDEKQLGEYAWFDGNTRDAEEYAHKVGMKKPNPWGLYDMHGNVDEWCSDCVPGDTDPVGPGGGSFRVVRSGCWGRGPECCRSAFRGFVIASFRNYDGPLAPYLEGFRVARSQSAQ